MQPSLLHPFLSWQVHVHTQHPYVLNVKCFHCLCNYRHFEIHYSYCCIIVIASMLYVDLCGKCASP